MSTTTTVMPADTVLAAVLKAMVDGCAKAVVAQLRDKAVDLTRSRLAALFDGLSQAADTLTSIGDALVEAVDDMARGDDVELYRDATSALNEISGQFGHLADNIGPRSAV